MLPTIPMISARSKIGVNAIAYAFGFLIIWHHTLLGLAELAGLSCFEEIRVVSVLIIPRSWLTSAQLNYVAGHLLLILQYQPSLKLLVLQPIKEVDVHQLFIFACCLRLLLHTVGLVLSHLGPLSGIQRQKVVQILLLNSVFLGDSSSRSLILCMS